MTILLQLVFRLGTAIERLGLRVQVFASQRLLPRPPDLPDSSRWSLASVLEDPIPPNTSAKPHDLTTSKQKSRTNE